MTDWHRIDGLGRWTNVTPDYLGLSLILNKNVSLRIFNGDEEAIQKVKTWAKAVTLLFGKNQTHFIEIRLNRAIVRDRSDAWLIFGNHKYWRQIRRE